MIRQPAPAIYSYLPLGWRVLKKAELQQKGYEGLYDDRDESAGVKFNNADLTGIPVRLTTGTNSLKAGGLEIKPLPEKDYQIVTLGDLEHAIWQPPS
jgi:prolyl-tRNA synthetase